MQILLNEIPGERCLFLGEEEFDLELVKAARGEHKITAILLREIGDDLKFLEKIKESGLKLGLIAKSPVAKRTKELIVRNYFDFVGLEAGEMESIKEDVGLLRASGTRHEVRVDIEGLGLPKAEETYELCKPCNSFVVYNAPALDFFVNFAKDKKNVILRNRD